MNKELLRVFADDKFMVSKVQQLQALFYVVEAGTRMKTFRVVFLLRMNAVTNIEI